MFGCSKSDDTDSTSLNNISTDATSITIFSSVTQTTAGNSVVFSVIDNKNIDRTSSSKIFVNGNQISSSSHVFNDTGSHEVYAQYLNLTSQKLTIEIEQDPIKFKKRVMVEDYTGTWCGYCTRVSYAIEQLKKRTSDAVIVAIHQGDAMQYENVNAMLSAFSVQGFPTALIDRAENWNYPEPSNVNQVLTKLNDDSTAGLALVSSINNNTLNIKLKLKMGQSFDGLKIGLYILESGLVYGQKNWTSYYASDPISNFIHDHVLRKSLTGILGDQVPSDKLGRENVFERDFQYQIPSSYNKDNIELVAFVTRSNSKKAINSRSSSIGESQSFEQIN